MNPLASAVSATRDDVSLHSVGVALLLALSWLVTDHYLPWRAFHSEVVAACAGALVVGAALWHTRRTGLCRASKVLFACALVPWLQWAAGQVLYAGDALLASLYLVGVGLCLWAGAALPPQRGEELRRAICWAALAASIFATGVALYQWLGLDGLNQLYVAPGVPGERAGTNFGQPNHAATLMCLALCGGLYLRAQGRLGAVSTAFLATHLAIGLAVTQSRVPWLALALLGLWWLVSRKNPLAAARLAPVVAVAWLCGYALLFVIVNRWSPELLAAAPATLDGSRVGAGRRPILWAQWLGGVQASPWIGYGWLQGHMAQAVGAAAHPGVESSDYAHMLPLDLLAWNGVPLGVVLIAACAAWYWRFGRRVIDAPSALGFAAVTLVVAHSLVEYAFTYAYFIVPVALLASGPNAAPHARGRHGRLVLALLSAAWLAAFIAVIHDYLRVEPDIRALREANARIGGARRTPPVEGLWVLDQMQAFSEAARIEPAPGMPPSQVIALESVSHRFVSAVLLQNTALAHAMNGGAEEAQREIRRICYLNGPEFYRLIVLQMAQTAQERRSAALAFAQAQADTVADLTDNRAVHCPGAPGAARSHQ